MSFIINKKITHKLKISTKNSTYILRHVCVSIQKYKDIYTHACIYIMQLSVLGHTTTNKEYMDEIKKQIGRCLCRRKGQTTLQSKEWIHERLSHFAIKDLQSHWTRQLKAPCNWNARTFYEMKQHFLIKVIIFYITFQLDESSRGLCFFFRTF